MLTKTLFFWTIVVSSAAFGANAGYGPWSLIWGDPDGGHIDICYKEDPSVFPTTFWNFRNLTATKVRIRYTYTHKDGRVSPVEQITLDSGAEGGDNNMAGGVGDPHIHILSVDKANPGNSNSQNYNGSGGVQVYPGPKKSPSPSPKH